MSSEFAAAAAPREFSLANTYLTSLSPIETWITIVITNYPSTEKKAGLHIIFYLLFYLKRRLPWLEVIGLPIRPPHAIIFPIPMAVISSNFPSLTTWLPPNLICFTLLSSLLRILFSPFLAKGFSILHAHIFLVEICMKQRVYETWTLEIHEFFF